MAPLNRLQQDQLLYNTLDDATRNNSLEKLREALHLSKEMSSSSDHSHREFLGSAVFGCLWDGNAPLLKHLIQEEKVNVASVSPLSVSQSPSIPLLEVLVENGWDVNKQAERGPNGRGRRLIDDVCDNEELVVWLVEHGARVDGGEDTYELFPQPAPLLETCAYYGKLSTFKYLQDRGARLSRRTLHRCALKAGFAGANPALDDTSASEMEEEEKTAANKRERSKMLRYLVDELQLDVNAMDTDIEDHWGHKGTPICYAASAKKGEAVVRWLLSKGADPRIKNKESNSDVEEVAMREGHEDIVEVIMEWKKQHESS